MTEYTSKLQWYSPEVISKFWHQYRTYIPIFTIILHLTFVASFANDCKTASEAGFTMWMIACGVFILITDVFLTQVEYHQFIPWLSRWSHALISLLQYVSISYIRAKPFKCFHEEYHYAEALTFLWVTQLFTCIGIYFDQKIFLVDRSQNMTPDNQLVSIPDDEDD